jgi:F-type H+-transporting ATPase subunit b
MPQLDFSTYASQLIWLAIVFVIFYLLMAGVGLPSVGRVLAARRGRIEGDLEKATQMKAEAEAVIAAYERALAEARVEAQGTIRETVEKLAAAAAERQREVVEKLATETAAAERRIFDAKTAALANLRDVAIDVARAAGAKLTGTEIDTARAGAAVDAVLRERA